MRTKTVPGLGTQTILDIDWQTLITMPEWLAQMAAPERLCDTRVEVIDSDGVWLQDVTPDGAAVTFDATLTARLKGSLQWVSDYPVDWTDLLHPLSGNDLRIWWQEWIPALGGWGEVLLLTGTPEDPDGDKQPALTWSIDLLDAAAEMLLNGSYGGQSVDVSGATVDVALGALLDVVAPGVPRSIPATTVTLPSTYVLGTNKPADDIAAICKPAGWAFCGDRAGNLTVDTGDLPSVPIADWTEGDDCRVSKLSRSVKTSEVVNAVRVTTTSSDLVPPMVGVAQDDDPTSPTWVGRFVRWYETTSDAATTQDAVDAAAAQIFTEKRYPTDSVKIECPARPDLMARSLVMLGSPDLGVAGGYRAQAWNITLPHGGEAPQNMTVTMADRSVEWTA